jgi:hypothetical protein
LENYLKFTQAITILLAMVVQWDAQGKNSLIFCLFDLQFSVPLPAMKLTYSQRLIRRDETD